MTKKAYCDFLWSVLIKARAGFKCEITGKYDYLHSHHLIGKSNLKARYSLDNGICINGGIHKFGFHNEGRKRKYERIVRTLRGKDIYERLQLQNRGTSKWKLAQYELFLIAELKQYTDEIEKWIVGKTDGKYKKLVKRLRET